MEIDAAEVAALEQDVNQAQEAVQRQGDIVRGLKAELKDGRVERVSWSRF
jgi:transcription antitermination factor NusA-like protein